MRKPGIVLGFDSHKIDDSCKEYCDQLNHFIRMVAINKGTSSVQPNFIGDVHEFRNDQLILTYKDSAYGNDHYLVWVHASFWNDLPQGVSPSMVTESGWNFVYHLQDSPDRQVLLHHIPGSWYDRLIKAR